MSGLAIDQRRARDNGWRTRAACRAAVVDPEAFFPTAERGPVHEAQVAAAKAICAECRVRAECLAEALLRILDGIAGGLTAEERRVLRQAITSRGLRRRHERRRVSAAEAAGRVLLAAGRPVCEVAARCGVSKRTAERWVARARAAGVLPGGQVSRGRHRGSPVDLPQPRTALAGTRVTEGRRV